MSSSQRLWTPTFVVLCLANIFSSLVFYLMASATATLASRAFDATTAQGGLSTGMFFIGAVLARITSGPTAERFGLRRTLLVGEITYALTSAAYLIIGSLGELIALRLLNGLAFGFVSTTLTSVALSKVPIRRRGEGTGWFTSGMALGTGLGPLISLNLLRVDGGERMVLLLTTFAGLIGLLLVLSVYTKLPGAIVHKPELHQQAPSLVSRFVEPRVLPIALVALLSATAFSLVLTYLNEFTTGTSLERAAGFYFLIYAAAMLFLRPPAGRLQDRLGNNVVMIPSLIALVSGITLTAIAETGGILLIGAALLGFGYGTLISSGQAMTLNMVDPTRATVAIASFFLLVDLGTGLGPSILGGFVELVGFRGMFGIGSGLAGLGLVLYLVLAAVLRKRRA
ncbi:MAG: MFS transporter [Brooklawnia sp.]